MIATGSRVSASRLHRIFSQYRMREDKDSDNRVKANMTELLGVYGLIRHWVETRCDYGSLEQEKNLF